MRPV
jgi:signal transduction histidine kinase